MRSLKAYTLALLARREYSRHELSAKMQRYVKRWEICPSEIDEVLVWLQAHGFQSDARFAAGLVRRRLDQFGNRAIAAELAQHGLTGGLFEEEPIATEEERALAWLRRRYACRFESQIEAEERKHLEIKAKRALAGRGFGFESVRKAWRTFLSEQEHLN